MCFKCVADWVVMEFAYQASCNSYREQERKPLERGSFLWIAAMLEIDSVAESIAIVPELGTVERLQ